MEYFLDTEFIELPGSIELISIGIVSNDGRELYAVSKDFNLKAAWADEWIRENVLKPIYHDFNREKNRAFTLHSLWWVIREYGQSKKEIAAEILDFIPEKTNPVFYGYYSAYDWVLFCQLFGRMIDLPKRSPMYCNDLKQIMDGMGLTKKDEGYPVQENEHNALADSYWNKDLYDFFLSEYEKSL